MSDILIENENLLRDFVDSAIEVLSTMAGMKVEFRDMKRIDGASGGLDVTTCMDITGVLGFSGGRRGSILLTLTEKIALEAIGGMLGMEFQEVDSDVRDGIGELVNMVAGGAKTKLQKKGIDFELSIPNTVVGPNHQIGAPASTNRTILNFNTEHGGFFIEVYMKRDGN